MSDTQEKPAGGLAAPMPAKHNFKPLRECTTLDEAFRTSEFMERIEASVPQHVRPNRMLRTFVQAVSKTPLLAQASIRSFVGSCLTLSQVGLEPNTPLQHAFLIPFKTKVFDPVTRKRDKEIVEINVIFGYPGLLDLSYRTSLVKNVHADVVWARDDFAFEYGSNAHLRHIPRGSHEPNEQPVWAYMHATLKDGQGFEVMPYSEVLVTRNRTQAYRAALAAKVTAEEKGWRVPGTWTEAPWVKHETAMARKTAFRAGSKWLPRSVELASVIELDEKQERHTRMDFGSVMDAPTIDGKADYLGAAVDAADQQQEDQTQTESGNREQERTESRTQVQVRKEPEPEQQQQTQGEPDRQAERKAERKTRGPNKPKESAPQESKPAEPEQSTGSGFEGYIVDQHGEVVSGAITDEAKFATEFMSVWIKAGRPPEMLEHNEDAIIDARLDAMADGILRDIDDDHPVGDQSTGGDLPDDQGGEEEQGEEAPPFEPEVIAPPQERGRVSWSAWTKLIKARLGTLATQELDPWCVAQRDQIAVAPIAQRQVAIGAIAGAYRTQNLAVPPWLTQLVSQAGSGPTAPADTSPEADIKWVDAMIGDLPQMNRSSFDRITGSQATRERMARIKERDPTLFARANEAFQARHKALPSVDID